MKKYFNLIWLAVILFFLFGSCQNLDIDSDRTEVTITDDDNRSMVLAAKFGQSRTRLIHEVINEFTFPIVIFKNLEDDIEDRFILANGTNFELEASECYLNIKCDKSKNTEESLAEVKIIFAKISEVLK